MGYTRMIVWQGISMLDNETPIIALATGVPWRGGKGAPSANEKTGPMVQIWILRADQSPLDTLADGTDTSICGTCPHRSPASGGTGACYVQVGRAPQGIWRAHTEHGSTPRHIEAFAGTDVRFGAYGDPAAVPFEVWDAIADVAHGVTGYTHAWRSADERFARIAMASVDSLAEWPEAKARGYRSFVVLPTGEAKPRGAVHCPASEERGKRTTCVSCLQCSGTDGGRSADVFINAHGPSKRAFLPLSVLA